MPYLTKRAISSFLRSECLRRLKLDLSPENAQYNPERLAQNMPPRSVVRPGLQALAAAGQEWEQEKVNDLVQAFGLAATIGVHQVVPSGGFQFDPVPLAQVIQRARPGSFLVQAEYAVGATFESALGIGGYRTTFNLDYAKLRPDLIQVLDPGTANQEVRADGAVATVTAGDPRVPLRVIDIKLTAEPSVPYLAEVTYYAMALAGWLVDNHHSGYLVVPSAAVWPGSHDASAVTKLCSAKRAVGQNPTAQELLQALEEDLEQVPFGVFAARLRRFFQTELQNVLAAGWTSLEWHVDNRCAGCEYLGYPWPGTANDPRHCWPTANAQGHLSRVAFMSRGARGALVANNIGNVTTLAATSSSNPAYNSHHTLRATKSVVAGRAQSLGSNQAFVPPQTGTSAVMPKWADLRIYITADFDIGSGITVAFGLKGFFWVHATRVKAGQQQTQVWSPQVFPIDQRSPAVEERELLHLLDAIYKMLQHATNSAQNPTVQVYLWDTVTYEHLVRVIGRHLPTIIGKKQLKHLAWLFPPDAVVPNPDVSDRKSPLTIVREVVRAIVAAPVPHYYSLLNVAREYHSTRTPAPINLFQVPSLFEDPLSDQIPSERAHEIWSRATGSRPWNVQLQQLDRTVKVRLSALESVAQRLADDLGSQLGQTAPRIADLGPPSLPRAMSYDSRLWFVFAKLNSALTELDVAQTRAMPPYEREARYRSAHLVRRLSLAAAAPHLSRLGLVASPTQWVYELAPGSREVKARDGDINFALAPRAIPGFLDQSFKKATNGAIVPMPSSTAEYTPMERVSSVSVVAVDRDHDIIVVELSSRWAPTLAAAEAIGALSFAQDVMLDPVHQDFLLDRLENTLNAIGNPPIATSLPAVAQALGGNRRPSAGVASPVADVLWDGQRLFAAPSGRSHTTTQGQLTRLGLRLNASQWQAWSDSLSRRLNLVWGPPGTGKSRTLRAVVLGVLHEAAAHGVPLCVLISGPTYEAIDNVLIDVHSDLSAGPLAIPTVTVGRLRRASSQPTPTNVPASIDAMHGSPLYGQIVQRLQNRQGPTLVGGTVHQVHRLLDGCGSPVSRLFDVIIIDEASQVDVAASTLALAGLADNGCVVVAGDPKQLPPIHQAQAPLGLDSFVGPVFTYLQERHQIPPSVLNVNYRSNATIVSLGQVAGYPPALQAHSPNLELDLLSPLPTSGTPPPNWPTQLFWTPEWSALLDPAQPCATFVYDEGRSSQWNPFEADAVSALIWLLFGRMASQLANELDSSGASIARSPVSYSPTEFWERGVGVVTPHRAQQALVVSGLQRLFGTAIPPTLIRGSVDTVERFQGQQRDVMIATFALGDPDAISTEDEFLLSLNRFNVMASRARAKLIVLVSRQVVDHLSADADVLRGSVLLKTFAETFCANSRSMSLGHFENGAVRNVLGELRWR